MSKKLMLNWKLFFSSLLWVSLSSFSQHARHFSEQAESMRDQAVTQIQDIFLKISADKKAELYFRLAEIYQAKANFAYAKEYQQFDIDYQKWFDSFRKGVEPKLSDYLLKSVKLRSLAIAQYQTLLNEYPRYNRLDEVLYALSYYQYESGDKTQSLQNYLNLIERFPGSIYIADAYLAVGDHYFRESNAQKAYAFYSQAFRLGMLGKKTAIYMYALYKQAWCDYNENRFENALQKFQQVVLLSQEAKTRQETLKTQGKDAVQLGQEALKDTVRIFAQLGQIKEAYLYFKSNLNADEAVLWMSKLANVLQKLGKYQEEIAVYVFLQTLSDSQVRKPAYAIAKLKAFVALEDRKNINLQSASLSELCEANKNPDCGEAEVFLRNLASKYHRFANQSKAQEDYQLARHLYGAYLRGFSQSEHFGQMQFFLGELLWEVGEWELAASLYDLVFLKNPDKSFAKITGINAVITWENIVSHEPRPHFLQGKLVRNTKRSVQLENIVFKKEDNLKPVAISAEAQNLINAIDRFTEFGESNPLSESEKEKTVDWIFKAGLLHQRNFHFDEAQKRFYKLIKQNPKAKQSVKAAILILDSLEARQNWEELAQVAQFFLQKPDFLIDEKMRLQVMQFEEGARFNSVLKAYENLTLQQNAGVAKVEAEALASRFEQFFKEFAQSQYGMKALYNAAIIYSQIQRIDLYIPVAEQWILLFKTRGLRDKESKKMASTLLSLLASIYEKAAFLEKAADAGEVYVDLLSDEPLAKDMLYLAANIRVTLEQNSRAAELYGKYLERYAKPEEWVKIQLLQATAYEKANQIQNAVTICQKISKANAFCSYQLLEGDWRAYQKIKMNVPLTQIKNQIKKKENKMAELIKSYLLILEHKDAEWGIWALLRVAEIQLDYVKSLRAMSKPKFLDKEAKKMLSEEVSNIVFPVEAEAISTLEKALEKAMELGLSSPVVQEIRRRLSEVGVKELETSES
jgi:cellulose synthase operon protein C